MLLTIGVIAFGLVRQTEAPPPPPKNLANVEVLTIEPRPYHETLRLPARVEADRIASVGSEFPGSLQEWLIPEGGFVREGEVVARLDDKIIRKELAELSASMQSAAKNISLARINSKSTRVALENSRQQASVQALALESAASALGLVQIEFKRIQKLVRKKVLGTSNLDTARNALTQADLAHKQAAAAAQSAILGIRAAQVRINEAEAALGLATARSAELQAAHASKEVRLEKTRLHAPISGRLETHLVKPGEVVATGDALALIYDLSFLRATVNVSDRHVAFLDPNNFAAKAFIEQNMPGAQLRISARLIMPGLPKLTGGNHTSMTFAADIARIALAADPRSNTFEVELRLPNPGGVFRHGFIARGEIEYLFYPQAIVIPLKSVQVTDEGPRVLVVEDDSQGVATVAIRAIEAISIQGDQLLVANGLAPKERLIVAGWKGLVSGEAVKVLVQDGRFVTNTAPTDAKGD